jgi:hypothetical protein
MTKPTSEDEVRDCWMAVQHESLNAWRRQMRANGWPLDLIEQMAQLSEAQSIANLEAALPLIMRDLAVTGGVASSH